MQNKLILLLHKIQFKIVNSTYYNSAFKQLLFETDNHSFNAETLVFNALWLYAIISEFGGYINRHKFDQWYITVL